MKQHATITLLRDPDEAQRLWHDDDLRPNLDGIDAEVSFKPAPGDRGTEIHVDLEKGPPGGKLGEAVLKLFGGDPLAKIKDDLRRFKQHVETGEITRSDATPEGETAGRKLKQRPAQPLKDSELEKAGA